jgi:hypothetical protein
LDFSCTADIELICLGLHDFDLHEAPARLWAFCGLGKQFEGL